MRLELIWISPFDFKSNAYTNSANRAHPHYITNHSSTQTAIAAFPASAAAAFPATAPSAAAVMS